MSAATQVTAAARALRRGAIVAYPTEAVWGLGCDPENSQALGKILELKQRDADKGLILVAASMVQFAWLLDALTAAERKLLAHSWPGPVTWLVPHAGRVHPLVCGVHSTVAIRVSAHPVVQSLCVAFGGPVVSTSANLQGMEPANDMCQVKTYFADRVDYILPGILGGLGRPTEIRDLATDRRIRW